MIHAVDGDILNTKAELIAHGVAPNDDFHSGLALALRERYPAMYKDFRHWCHTHAPKPGTVFAWAGPGAHVAPALQSPSSGIRHTLPAAASHVSPPAQGTDWSHVPLAGARQTDCWHRYGATHETSPPQAPPAFRAQLPPAQVVPVSQGIPAPHDPPARTAHVPDAQVSDERQCNVALHEPPAATRHSSASHTAGDAHGTPPAHDAPAAREQRPPEHVVPVVQRCPPEQLPPAGTAHTPPSHSRPAAQGVNVVQAVPALPTHFVASHA